MSGQEAHAPVLVAEVMDLLSPSRGDLTVETMVGAGGHSAEFLRRTAPDGRLVGIDRDPAILEVARRALEPFKHRVSLREGCSDALRDILAESGEGAPQIVFMDLGVSSLQLDDAARGFSFRADGPLDMRMSTSGATAADLLARLSAEELEGIFRDYGDEPFARRIARAIVDRRKTTRFRTTKDLADLVAGLVPGRLMGRRFVHPATRVFQALRIAVNDERGMLERTLPAAWDALAPGGRLGVISFHSGEDRVVKNFVRDLHKARVADVLAKKPIRPGPAEAAGNPRSRSALLRGALKRHTPAEPRRNRYRKQEGDLT
jgi:16S rRNA (cytosine1402-N4)-methyltransferase